VYLHKKGSKNKERERKTETERKNERVHTVVVKADSSRISESLV